MTSRSAILPPPTSRAHPSFVGPRTNGVGYAALACALSIAAGILLDAAPLAMLGLAGVVIATAVFAAWPYAVLLAVLLVRPSLDASGSILSVGGDNAAGAIGAVVAGAGLLALLVKAPHVRGRLVAVPLVLFVAMACASITYSLDPSRATSL